MALGTLHSLGPLCLFNSARRPTEWISESGVFPEHGQLFRLPASTLSFAPFPRKAAARTALVGLNDAARVPCWRSVSASSALKRWSISSDAAERLRKEKFEACVLALGDGADTLMEAARSFALQQPLHHLRRGRQRAGSHALFEVRHQRHVPGTAGTAGRAEADARHAHAGAARISPLRTHSGHDRSRRSSVTDAASLRPASKSVPAACRSRAPKTSPSASPVEMSFALMTLPRVNRARHRELAQAQVVRCPLRSRRRAPPESQTLDRLLPGKLMLHLKDVSFMWGQPPSAVRRAQARLRFWIWLTPAACAASRYH